MHYKKYFQFQIKLVPQHIVVNKKIEKAKPLIQEENFKKQRKLQQILQQDQQQSILKSNDTMCSTLEDQIIISPKPEQVEPSQLQKSDSPKAAEGMRCLKATQQTLLKLHQFKFLKDNKIIAMHNSKNNGITNINNSLQLLRYLKENGQQLLAENPLIHKYKLPEILQKPQKPLIIRKHTISEKQKLNVKSPSLQQYYFQRQPPNTADNRCREMCVDCLQQQQQSFDQDQPQLHFDIIQYVKVEKEDIELHKKKEVIRQSPSNISRNYQLNSNRSSQEHIDRQIKSEQRKKPVKTPLVSEGMRIIQRYLSSQSKRKINDEPAAIDAESPSSQKRNTVSDFEYYQYIHSYPKERIVIEDKPNRTNDGIYVQFKEDFSQNDKNKQKILTTNKSKLSLLKPVLKVAAAKSKKGAK